VQSSTAIALSQGGNCFPQTTRDRDVDPTEARLIASVLEGDTASFDPIVKAYSPRLFATARRYARCESDVEDTVQEIWCKAFQKLGTFRGDAPFEHWLMRLAVRTCYDLLRRQRRRREATFSELTGPEQDWLNRCLADPGPAKERAEAARLLVQRLLEQLTPPARLVITLLEIEEHSVKEISALTGWSVSLVKVRAFRARRQMKRILATMTPEQYL
jgi:RNA polymerase sigma-70 factor, ECF subfamily